jgi:hypothetical protein
MSTTADILRLVWAVIMTDRAVQAGASTSGVSLFGGMTIQRAHEWVGIYATLIGAIGATATTVLVCIKIYRLLRDPASKD